MKKKKLPDAVTGTVLEPLFQSRPGRLVTNWVLQGMLYMNAAEIYFKLILDLMIAGLIILLIKPDTIVGAIIIIIISHTVNWIINCQPVALLMHMDIGSKRPETFVRYVEGLAKRINNTSFLACAAYGSLSTGNYKPSSDIDIRLIVEDRLATKIKGAWFCFLERFRAFIFMFPLDMYMFTLEEVLIKMEPSEPPIIIMDKDAVLANSYQDIVEFDDFVKNFKQKQL